MEKRITFYPPQTWRGRFLGTILTLVALLLGATQVGAQNVTIGPYNGSLITGLAGGNSADSGAGRGMSSMWRHEQLSLTMTTSDIANLTGAGELADPSNAIDTFDVDRVLPPTGRVTQNGPEPTRLIIGAGQTQTFIVVSLPKGYRITRYRLVLQPNISGNGILLHQNVPASVSPNNTEIKYDTWDIGTDDQMSFYETPAWSKGSPYGNNTHSSQLTCPDALATATAADGSTVMLNNNPTNRAKEFVIERTSMTDDDMSNQLYFFFASRQNSNGNTPYRYAVSIKSFEIHFTAQGTFDAQVAPVTSSNAVSVVSSPFPTSKMDIGGLTWRTWTNNDGTVTKPVYAYDFSQVRDLIGYNTLYQEDAVSSGKPKEDVANENHIYPLELNGTGVYAFGNGTYYVEPPVSITGSSGLPAPIGFRVVGAKFTSDWGEARKATNITIKNGCTISVRYNREDYYLNSNLDFVRATNQNPAFVWKMDEYGNLYYGNEYKHYLACFGEGETRILSVSSSATGNAAKWNLKIDDNNRVVYHSDGGNNYYLYYTRIQEGNDYHLRGYVELNHNNDLATARVLEDGHTLTIPAYAPGDFTLVVYDEKGDVKERVPVNSTNYKNLSYELTGLNNDALKFGIEGLGLVQDPAHPDDPEKKVQAQAVVIVTLQLESLNPYIDKMDIVCHDIPTTGDPTLELTQTFTADDFSVSGGKFVFYVPEAYSEVPLKFTFSDLWSKYGDDTYYNDRADMKMNGNARYSFVTSEYFRDVDGEDGDGGLYGSNYQSGDKGSNGPNDGGDYYPYVKKVNTSTAGNVRYKFSNAEDLMNPSDEGNFLEEYPFSVDKYLHGEDGNGYANPDPEGPATAAFENCIMIATPTPTLPDYQSSETYYVFTADETRYNIAPTTAWEHRLYAFYRMDIELEARSFEPNFTWTKIYEETDYESKDQSGKVIDANDSMWGLTLGTKPVYDENNQLVVDDNGKPIKGYFTYQEIVDEIKNNLLDEDNVNGPSDMKQILYVDGTPLKEMLNSNTASTTAKTLQDFKNMLAVNALVFLPENTTSTLDNVVLEETGMSQTRSFVAGKDIVLKDKQPFFTPYSFKIDAANKVTYSREISGTGNTLAKYATIMMPFTLTVTDGKHTNVTDDGFEFYLRTMTGFNGAQTGAAAAEGYFTKIEGTLAEANTPYMVEVVEQKSDVYSFVATQKGAEIIASRSRTATTANPWIGLTAIEAEKVGDMTNYGTYSGRAIPRANEVFYFNKNKYVSSETLASKYTHVYVRPFRSYYTSSAQNSKMTWFDIVYDQIFSPVVTDIATESLPNNLAITSGHGFIMLTANEDVHVNVVSLNGFNVASFGMEAGDQNVIEIPSGIYLVNKTKVIVK